MCVSCSCVCMVAPSCVCIVWWLPHVCVSYGGSLMCVYRMVAPSPYPPRTQCSPWQSAALSRWLPLSGVLASDLASCVPVRLTVLWSWSWTQPAPSSGCHSDSFGLVRSGNSCAALGMGIHWTSLMLGDCCLATPLPGFSTPPSQRSECC